MKGQAAAAVFAATLAAALVSAMPASAMPAPSSAAHAVAPTGTVTTFGSMREAPNVHLPATHLPHPVVKNGTYQTENWAGYAVTGRGGKTIPQVNDDFTIPSINCANSTIGSSGYAYVSDWAGLDGLVDATVEQEGIDAYCTSTSSPPAYLAWYEMYPNPPVAFTGTVNPGDAITVETERVGANYVLTFDDVTTASGFTTTQPCPSGSTCYDNSAEVITEDPGGAVAGGIDLADFGMDNQTGILAHTYNGLRGSFGTCTYWTQQTVEMFDPSNHQMAPLSTMYGAQSFNVTWAVGS